MQAHDQPPSRQRRNLLRVFTLATLLPGGLVGVIRESLAAGSKPGTADGVYRLEGSVRFNGKTLQVKDKVVPPVEVVTGQDALAIFVVGGDAYLVRGNSRLKIAAATQNRGSDLLLQAGRTLAVFAKGERQIKTVTATIGIRGTGIYLDAKPEVTYACLCYGLAEVGPSQAPKLAEALRTQHHEAPRYIYKDRMQPAAVIDHTDEELILLEGLTGRVPPFYDQYYGYGSDGILGDINREKRYKQTE
jgi:hypothetical protein